MPLFNLLALTSFSTAPFMDRLLVCTVPLNRERAVMDVELCYRVGMMRAERFREKSQSKPDTGNRADVRIFPLSRITYCAHCEKLAIERDDPSLRGYLIGYDGSHSPRYRHSERRHKCDSHNKSVKAEVLEQEFARLIAALTIRPDVIPQMVAQLALFNQQDLTEDRRGEIITEINLCRQRIRNTEKLFIMARIDEETLKKHISDNENQIAHLQTVMNEEGQIRQMVEVTANMLIDMGGRWQEASAEDKQAFVHTLFSEIIFDLDTHQITDFTLKAWAAQFLQISAAQDGAVMWLEGYMPIGVPCCAGRYAALYRGCVGLHLYTRSRESTQNRQKAA